MEQTKFTLMNVGQEIYLVWSRATDRPRPLWCYLLPDHAFLASIVLSMRPDLQARFLKVADNLDKIGQALVFLDSLDSDATTPILPLSAMIGAEVIAASAGVNDPSTLHRAYEEVLASLMESPTIQDLLRKQTKEASSETINMLQKFRSQLLYLR